MSLKTNDRVRIKTKFKGRYPEYTGTGEVIQTTSLGIAVKVRLGVKRGEQVPSETWVEMDHLEKVE